MYPSACSQVMPFTWLNFFMTRPHVFPQQVWQASLQSGLQLNKNCSLKKHHDICLMWSMNGIFLKLIVFVATVKQSYKKFYGTAEKGCFQVNFLWFLKMCAMQGCENISWLHAVHFILEAFLAGVFVCTVKLGMLTVNPRYIYLVYGKFSC